LDFNPFDGKNYALGLDFSGTNSSSLNIPTVYRQTTECFIKKMILSGKVKEYVLNLIIINSILQNKTL